MPRLDLLESHADSKNFVAETEDDGTTSLRLGDGTLGIQVIPGDICSAQYRIGGGTAGNVGMNSLCRIASDDAVLKGNVITSVTNPIAATGGLDAETLDHVRANAPYAFNIQNRAVTLAEPGAGGQRVDPALQQAVGTFRWTGSWYTVSVSVDPDGGGAVDAATATSIVDGLENYRMMGHDVEVNAPVYVSLALTLDVCPQPGYLAADVQQAVLQLLGPGTLPGGSPALFNPDNLTFGQPVYLSPIVAAVQQTAGVASVTVITFERQGQDSTSGIATGFIPLQPFEIARLDNDPDYPEHGVLTVNVYGATAMANGCTCATLTCCGCCEGITQETPQAIQNRPGLGAIAYRTRTYNTFYQTLLARIAQSRQPSLRQLRSREPDDFTIALLDAFSVMGDVLTFYTERIANEAYLDTRHRNAFRCLACESRRLSHVAGSRRRSLSCFQHRSRRRRLRRGHQHPAQRHACPGLHSGTARARLGAIGP